MELIKNFIFSLCGASITVSIAKMILDSSAMKKSVNIFISIFLLFYMISPFGKTVKPFTSSEFNPDVNNVIINDGYYDSFIYMSVKSVCSEENCIAENIIIHKTDLSDEEVIEYVEITIDNPEKADIISKRLKNEFGFEVKVN